MNTPDNLARKRNFDRAQLRTWEDEGGRVVPEVSAGPEVDTPEFKYARVGKRELEIRERREIDGFTRLFLAVFFPPLAVAWVYGLSKKTFVCLLLTVLGHLPGVIYALWLLGKPSELEEKLERDEVYTGKR